MSNDAADELALERQALELYANLHISLRGDGYARQALKQLTVEHMVALTHGELREPDGTVQLPTPAPAEPDAAQRVSAQSLGMMKALLHVLVKLGFFDADLLLVEVMQRVQLRVGPEPLALNRRSSTLKRKR